MRVTRPGLGFIEPRLPSPAKAPPSGPGWLHEIKHDIPGIDHDTFQSIASKAKAWCPVSKLMNAEIGFEAILVS
jgi:organic hydroperoxide reductase OsmC/OhrA